MSFIELETPDQLEYKFNSVANGLFSFKVRAAHDAHIALTTGPHESDPMIEIFIGGWSNTKSVIRKNRTKPDKSEANTPDILNAGEYRGFWIKWFDGVYTVGNEGEAAAFLSYQDNEIIPINFAGVCTAWGATGSWILEAGRPYGGSAVPISCGVGQTCWVPSAGSSLPDGAVAGGRDSDGTVLYVGRAHHEGALIPGKLNISHGVVYVPWGGAEHAHADYEVLVGGGNWVPVAGGAIPGNAIPAGESEDGEPLFVGRAHHEGSVTIGKVQPSHNVCYISYGGSEIAYDQYEILTN
jgi:hypothetical protein